MTALNDRQQQILDTLVASGLGQEEEPGLATLLRDTLESGLGPLVQTLPPGERLWASKYDIQEALTCEAGFAARKQEPFEWTPATARGTLIHRAIERSILGTNHLSPFDLAEQAAQYFIENDVKRGLGEALSDMSDDGRHDLLRDVADAVTKFEADWPQIDRRSIPRTEMTLKVSLVAGRAILQAKVDFALGVAQGNRRGSKLVEFKSGLPHAHHRDELVFYALLETLVRSIAPAQIALYYPDLGFLDALQVSTEMLITEVGRVIQGAEHICRASTLPFDELKTTGNPSCAWCPLKSSCPDSTATGH